MKIGSAGGLESVDLLDFRNTKNQFFYRKSGMVLSATAASPSATWIAMAACTKPATIP